MGVMKERQLMGVAEKERDIRINEKFQFSKVKEKL
jgi:hypothetical protein